MVVIMTVKLKVYTVKPRLLQPRLLQALGYCKVFGLSDFLPRPHFLSQN